MIEAEGLRKVLNKLGKRAAKTGTDFVFNVANKTTSALQLAAGVSSGAAKKPLNNSSNFSSWKYSVQKFVVKYRD